MTTAKRSKKLPCAQSLASADRVFLRAPLRETPQGVQGGEITEFLGATRGERTDYRNGYRVGDYSRDWVTRTVA